MKRVLTAVLAIAAVAATGAVAQVAGEWNVTAEVRLARDVGADGVEVPADCFYSGTAIFTETGGTFEGPVKLNLDLANDDACPGTLSGDATGTDSGGNISGTITTGMMESLDFGASPVLAATMANQYNGNFLVNAGPFQNSSGIFVAMRAPSMPAAGTTALLVLALLLLTAGAVALRRPRTSG